MSDNLNEEDLKKLFFKEKRVGTVVAIRQNTLGNICVSEVSKIIDSTYAHTCKIISELDEKEILNKKKDGRKKHIELTDYGEDLADLMMKLFDICEGKEELQEEEEHSISEDTSPIAEKYGSFFDTDPSNA